MYLCLLAIPLLCGLVSCGSTFMDNSKVVSKYISGHYSDVQNAVQCLSRMIISGLFGLLFFILAILCIIVHLIENPSSSSSGDEMYWYSVY